jgi:hypothetical protein
LEGQRLKVEDFNQATHASPGLGTLRNSGQQVQSSFRLVLGNQRAS